MDKMNIDESREYLRKLCNEAFQDKTFNHYIEKTLAGDFATEIAQVYKTLEDKHIKLIDDFNAKELASEQKPVAAMTSYEIFILSPSKVSNISKDDLEKSIGENVELLYTTPPDQSAKIAELEAEIAERDRLAKLEREALIQQCADIVKKYTYQEVAKRWTSYTTKCAHGEILALLEVKE